MSPTHSSKYGANNAIAKPLRCFLMQTAPAKTAMGTREEYSKG